MYVITEGEYSDTEILGYFEKEEEAERYCFENKMCFYEEIEVLSLTEKQSKIKRYNEYYINVYRSGRVALEKGMCSTYLGEKREKKVIELPERHLFILTARTNEVAKKIVCDCMAKIKAGKKGV